MASYFICFLALSVYLFSFSNGLEVNQDPMYSPAKIFSSRQEPTEQVCEDKTLVLCNPKGVSQVCCPKDYLCCMNSSNVYTFCVPEGGKCCDGGGACEEGYDCCGEGCIPEGAVCCEGEQGWCPTNTTCMEPTEEQPEWLCSSAQALTLNNLSLLFVLAFFVQTLLFL